MAKKGRNNKKVNNKHKQSHQKNQKNGRHMSPKNRFESYNSEDETPMDLSIKSSKAERRGAEPLDMSSLHNSLPTAADCGHKSKSLLSTNYSPKGLHNLGNTCFMNSVLQVISETHLLFDLLNERANDGYVYRAKSIPNPNEWSADSQTEELETSLDQCFPLTQNVITFMREMRANGSRVVSPSNVLKSVRKEWSQFDGYAQQDSHELLRCLLDSLKGKEVKRQRRAVVNEIKTQTLAFDTEDKNLDDDTKTRIKSYATYTSLTPIDAVFGGQLLSSVCCDVCKSTSLKFEPFFDLSLPLYHLKNGYTNSNSILIENSSNKSEDKSKSKPEPKNLIGKDPKDLTTRERKQLKGQKKAAKREAKHQWKAKKTIDISDNKENDAISNANDVSDNKPEESSQQELTNNEDWPEVSVNKPEDCPQQEMTNNDDWPEISDNKAEDSSQQELTTNDVWPGASDWEDSGHKTEEHSSEDLKESFTISGDIEIPWGETTEWTNQGKSLDELVKDNDAVEGIPEEGEDIHIEPLLSDHEGNQAWNSEIKAEEWNFNDKQEIVDKEEDVLNYINGLFGDDNPPYEEWPTNNGWNDWKEDGWNTPSGTTIQPFYGPALPPTDLVIEEDSDEYKVQELDFEAEALMSSNISDKEKLDIKQSSDQSNGSQEFDWNSKRVKEIIEICLKTITTTDSNDKLPNFDLLRLLSHFTSVEALTGANKYYCETCTKMCAEEEDKEVAKQLTNASKRTLIALPPPVLTLHLKRFEAEGYRRSVSLRKISTFVSFPLTFDLSPFVSQMSTYLPTVNGQRTASQTSLIYGLYGVVQHSGTLRSGHYTAYVKFRPNNCRQTKKFSFVETFVAKVENVLKVIENNYFNDNNNNNDNNHNNNNESSDDNSVEPTTSGYETATNSTTSATEAQEDGQQEYSCSSNDSGKWFHISDSSVSSSSLAAVLKSNAYLLFYERIA